MPGIIVEYKLLLEIGFLSKFEWRGNVSIRDAIFNYDGRDNYRETGETTTGWTKATDKDSICKSGWMPALPRHTTGLRGISSLFFYHVRCGRAHTGRPSRCIRAKKRINRGKVLHTLIGHWSLPVARRNFTPTQARSSRPFDASTMIPPPWKPSSSSLSPPFFFCAFDPGEILD